MGCVGCKKRKNIDGGKIHPIEEKRENVDVGKNDNIRERVREAPKIKRLVPRRINEEIFMRTGDPLELAEGGKFKSEFLRSDYHCNLMRRRYKHRRSKTEGSVSVFVNGNKHQSENLQTTEALIFANQLKKAFVLSRSPSLVKTKINTRCPSTNTTNNYYIELFE